MADVPGVADEVMDALAAAVAGAIPLLKSRIPPVPAAQLGRPGASPGGSLARLHQLSEPLLVERLLGALELTIPHLSLDGAPDLAPYLPGSGAAGPGARRTVVSTVRAGGEGEATASARILEQFRPGSSDLAVALCRRLAGHQLIVPLLAVTAPVALSDGAAADGAAAEEAVAAAHGTGYLALCVAVGWAVAGQGQVLRGPALDVVAAVVGLGVFVAQALLVEVPMPEAYAAVLLARIRAEYLLPRWAGGEVMVAGYRFALTEGDFPDAADFSGNGLVAVVPGGVVIRTGTADGPVTVMARVHAGEPERLKMESWDEIVDVSWHADEGLASVIGPDAEAAAPGSADPRRARFKNRLRRFTPPWPGDYRLRVCASGRDDPDDEERYELEIWQAPPAPEIVHKRADRLGYRLRGEPEPDAIPAPWREYRWLMRTVLDVHGTITVVTGASAAEAVRAFGGDPERPEPLSEILSEEIRSQSLDSTLAVLPVTAAGGGSAVIVIESIGSQGSDMRVLERASANGRAASFHQNAKGMTILSFAEGGEVLVSYEPFGPPDEDAGPAVAAAIDGLDFADVRDHGEKCLVAVERFTGCGITPANMEQIRSADVGYWVRRLPVQEVLLP
jgi:hypothetical protein